MRRSIITAVCTSLAFLALTGPAAAHHQDFRECNLIEKRLIPALACQPEPEPPAAVIPADPVTEPVAPQKPAKATRRCAGRKAKRVRAKSKRCARARKNARSRRA